MGLDMYLERETFFMGVGWKNTPDERLMPPDMSELNIDRTKVQTITEQIGYWRKANAIHKWFVDHCNDGNDNNGEMDVSREQLQELLDTCNKVLSIAQQKLEPGKVKVGAHAGPETNHQWVDDLEDGLRIFDYDEIEKLLPTQEGFFFGSTEYDENYVEDIKETIRILTDALATPSSTDETWVDFKYRASW